MCRTQEEARSPCGSPLRGEAPRAGTCRKATGAQRHTWNMTGPEIEVGHGPKAWRTVPTNTLTSLHVFTENARELAASWKAPSRTIPLSTERVESPIKPRATRHVQPLRHQEDSETMDRSPKVFRESDPREPAGAGAMGRSSTRSKSKRSERSSPGNQILALVVTEHAGRGNVNASRPGLVRRQVS